MLGNIVALTSSAYKSCQEQFALDAGAKQGLVIQRSFDSTPILLKFGKLQKDLFSSARCPRSVDISSVANRIFESFLAAPSVD